MSMSQFGPTLILIVFLAIVARFQVAVRADADSQFRVATAEWLVSP
jgi:hypothetical protein